LKEASVSEKCFCRRVSSWSLAMPERDAMVVVVVVVGWRLGVRGG
jgi:hypothetical protein